MKLLVWDSESSELESFFDSAESFASLDIFEDLDDLVEEVIDGDVVVFDLDSQTKEVEKAVNRIKKNKVDFVLIFLTNKMDQKKIAKHQKSKFGGQLYVKTPIEDKLLANMLQPFVDEKIQIGLSEDDQNMILKGHVDSAELSEEVKQLSDKFDSVFSEVFGDNQSAQNLAAVDKTSGAIDASDSAPLDVGLDDTGEFDISLGGDSNDSGEDLLIADDDAGEELSLSDETSEDQSLSLSEEDEEQETILPNDDDLAFPDMDDLSYPDEGEMSLSEASDSPEVNEEPIMANDDNDELSLDVDAQESGVGELDLSADDDGAELSLGDESAAEVIDTSEEGALDLSVDDSGVDELSLGADDAAEVIDTSEEGALDLSVDDRGGDLDLSAGGDEAQTIDLSEEGALDLSEDAAVDLSANEVEAAPELPTEAPMTPPDEGGDDDMGLEFGSDDVAENDLADLDFGSGEEASTDEVAMEAVGGDLGDDLGADLGADLDDDLLGDDLLGDDLGDELSDDALFGDSAALDDEINSLDDMSLDDGLSSDQLPASPDLGGEDLSTNAKVQLAEIDAMMGDASDIVTTELDSTEALTGEQFERTEKTDGLAKELNAMSPEFDATSEDKTEIMDESMVTKPIEAPYKTQTGISSNQIDEHREVMAHSNEELVRLGETIKNLREDREKLLEKVYHFEEEKNKEKQDFINLQAELDERKIELSLTRKRYEKQIDDYRYQLDISQQKKQMLEEKNKQLEKDVERLSKKSNADMTRIRARETELENKLDLLRADSEMQIKNRDQKILELKRRIDTLEFDVESMHMKERKVVDSNVELEEKMDRVIRTLRHAIGELEDNDNSIHHLEKVKKNLDI